MKTYSRKEIAHIAGIDLWREDCVYIPKTIRVDDIKNIQEFRNELQSNGSCEYIDSMVNRLKMGGGLAAIIVENGYVTDGQHRTLAHLIAGKETINVLERVSKPPVPPPDRIIREGRSTPKPSQFD